MTRYLVVSSVLLLLFAAGCGSGSSDNSGMEVGGGTPELVDLGFTDDGKPIPPPPVDTDSETIAPLVDVPLMKDDGTPKEEIPGPTYEVIPEYLPDALPLVWTNLQDRDMVTVRKKIVLEFEKGTRFPEHKSELGWYNQVFEVHVTLWDDTTATAGAEVPVNVKWRQVKKGMHRWPALVIEAAPCEPPDSEEEESPCPVGAEIPQWLPTQAHRVTIWLGDQIFDRVFHTIPGWAPGYKITEFTVQPEQCERCYPHPVKVHVFIPPEYDSPDQEINNTSIPWNNKNQRYPAVVGLHTYGGQGMTLADTFGWATLPRFTAQGVLEPMFLVLPDATVPEPYCGGGWTWGVNQQKTCYTQFMGIPNDGLIPDFNSYTNYSYFMTHTMRKAVAKRFRVRGMDDDGNKLDNEGEIIDEEFPDDNAGRDHYRRAWGISGCSGGGYGTPINAILFAKDYGAMLALIGAWPSMFNPYAYWNWTPEDASGPITKQKVCNNDGNGSYPKDPMGDNGYRDLSFIDPDTIVPCPEGQLCKRPQDCCRPAEECEGCDAEPCRGTGDNRDMTIEQRHIPAGAKSCFWATPPPLANPIVLAYLCGLDVTCRVDPDAPEQWQSDLKKYDFDGNLMFTTAIRDTEGPPAGFMDFDQQLDKQGIVHSFRYEDRGAVYHSWNFVHDYVEGWPEITRKNGDISPGNFPGTGILYPYMNNAFEGLGNHPFNHPFASEFTTGAMDPDRDYYIDCIPPNKPELTYVEDNCPGVYNPNQEDSDDDGIGDACDD